MIILRPYDLRDILIRRNLFAIVIFLLLRDLPLFVYILMRVVINAVKYLQIRAILRFIQLLIYHLLFYCYVQSLITDINKKSTETMTKFFKYIIFV